MISIKHLSKAEALMRLFNNSKTQGMSQLAYDYDGKDMSLKEAEIIISSGNLSFDYLKGRIMKVNLSKDEFDPWLYDRDNGAGAALRAIGDSNKLLEFLK